MSEPILYGKKCDRCGRTYSIYSGIGGGIIGGECPKCAEARRQASVGYRGFVEPKSPMLGDLIGPLVASPPAKPAQPPKPTNVQVILDKESEKRISTEKLHIPLGVEVTTERSRTFERTIVLDWHEATNKGIRVGFKDVLSGRIRKEIERQLGAELKEQETTTCKVVLEGKKNSYYTLTWTDVWREGIVKYQLGNQTQSLPIRFRERTELCIESIPKTRTRSKK